MAAGELERRVLEMKMKDVLPAEYGDKGIYTVSKYATFHEIGDKLLNPGNLASVVAVLDEDDKVCGMIKRIGLIAAFSERVKNPYASPRPTNEMTEEEIVGLGPPYPCVDICSTVQDVLDELKAHKNVRSRPNDVVVVVEDGEYRGLFGKNEMVPLFHKYVVEVRSGKRDIREGAKFGADE